MHQPHQPTKEMRDRLHRALCVGTLCELEQRVLQEFQDMLAQKFSTAYLMAGETKEILDYLCGQFGLKKPQK